MVGEGRILVFGKKVPSRIMLIVLLIGVLTFPFNVEPVKASGTIYIRADGSVDPSTAPISTYDNVTYAFIDDICAESVVIEKDDVVIDGNGYMLNGSVSGIRGFDISYRNNVTVKNTRITKFGNGIYVYHSNSCRILNNMVSDCSYAIDVMHSSNNNTVSDNFVDNCYGGISVDYSSNDNSVANNTVTNSKSYGWGLYLWASSGNVFSNNIARNNSKGMDIRNAVNNAIHHNNISGNQRGVYLSSSSNNIISQNNITANVEIGIYILTHSSNNIISGNIITNNTYHGLELYENSANNSIVGNTVINNQYGIWLHHYSDYNYVAKNTVTNNTVGIRLSESAAHNRISGNDVLANIFGINFEAFADNNLIYHNNFISNTQHIEYASLNVWDSGYPSGGNYWSNYTGADADNDGIGDTPHIIDADNQDRYPLMHPWNVLNPVHNINTGLSYATIQEAINAPETLNGHAIFAETGTYYENVVVDKTVLLVGENKERTIIDGSRIGNVVHVVANNTVISNFSIQNGGPTYFGIRFDHSSHNRLINNNIINNYGSIDLFYSSNNTLSNNTVTSNYDGIHLSDAFNNTISNNNIASNLNYGIHLWHSFDNIVFENNVTNNYWYGIYLGNSSNNTFFGNTVASNGEDGILLEMSSNYNIMLDNNIRNNKGGIWLSPSCNNIISGNNIATNELGGIYLYYFSNNNSINGNTIANNDFGVLVYYSLSNAIHGNNITANNRYGVALYSYSKNNIVNTNNLINNGEGIYLEGSSDNSIYHNNFINNSKQAFSYYSVNTWDEGYPSGGNYWSDYAGFDIKSGPSQNLPGSDGLGDTPYIIDPDNVDHYPVMNPYGTPPPPTYTLTITTTAGGTTNPAPGTYSYTANQTVQVTAISEAGYLFEHWELDSVNVDSANPYPVLMDKDHVLKAVFTAIPPPLLVSISPLSASILVGQSVTFTSTVSGGYTPYSYQWYLNGNPVSGANGTNCTFTPTSSGVYYIHLKVTDAKGNTAQSDAARITVATVPVGGYSIPIQIHTKAEPIIPCITLIAILTTIFVEAKRKMKRKH